MGLIKKVFGLIVAPEWSLASIGARLVLALLTTGGVYYTASTAYANWKNSICAEKVTDITSTLKDQTIATLNARVAALTAQNQNLEARRADDQLAVQEADESAKNAIAALKDLQGQTPVTFLTDAEVDILNGVASKTGAKK